MRLAATAMPLMPSAGIRPKLAVVEASGTGAAVTSKIAVRGLTVLALGVVIVSVSPTSE